MKRRLLIWILTTALFLTACGPNAAATTMHLKRTEGTVGIVDGGGKDIVPAENLGLYSGYGVDTQSASYAWIDLDEVKLTKLDQDSEIVIQKEGRKLEIEVKSGSLFFNVTQPLEDNETMEIRTSSMMVGIRGTCGWVEAPDKTHMNVYLLEGEVRCEAEGESETVQAGEMAVLTEDGTITVAEFSASDIPEFVVEEIKGDDDLINAILSDSGIDVLNPIDPQDDINRRAALLEILNNNSGASYAGLFDMDQDGREDLLVLNKVGQYASFRWTAYLWDGSAAQPTDLTFTHRSQYDTHTTDDIYTVTAGVCRERDTGTVYVRYYGEYVGGAYDDYFVSLAGGEEIAAPFWGGGYDGEEWRQQKEQEQREYDAMLADRFETLAELTVGGFDGVGDYTGTIDEVRRQLTAE